MFSNLRKNLYNKRSSKKLGWRPSWFDVSGFGNGLIEKIKQFQRSHDLKDDGMCGSMTYRRILARQEASLDPEVSYIILEGNKVEVPWDKVIALDATGNLALPSSCYRKKDRPDPSQIVTHFDVCLSAASCKRVLEKRGISSHFVIDNDGTIYQMVDTAYEAWHAPPANRRSIGIDISNAYYLKYNKTYEKRGHGRRPVLRNLPLHGTKIKECLGFYDVQIEAYKALINVLCDFYDIPVECPKDGNGELLRKVSTDARSGKFKGVVCHYHITRKKIDCVNLELKDVLDDIRSGRSALSSTEVKL